VLGGILSHTFHNNSHHHGNSVVHTRVVEKPQTVIHHRYEYEDESAPVVHQEENLPLVEIETRLLLDAEGRCFAITRNEEGKELLAQVDQAQCEP